MADIEVDGIVLTDEKKKLTGWIKASQSGLIGLAQAGVAAFTLSPASAIGSVASFFKAAGDVSSSDPPGRIALGMVMAALLRTFHSCANEILEGKKPSKKQLDTLAKAVVEKLASGTHTINRDFFFRPSSFDFLGEFAKELPAHLGLNTTQAQNSANEALLRSQFPLALDRVLIDQPDLFKPLRERLDNPASDAARRERERRLYQASLVKWFETYPLPGQEEENDPVLLSQVFIPLRCYTEAVEPTRDVEPARLPRRGYVDDDERIAGSEIGKIVREPHWLADLIRRFVTTADPKNPVLMVSGGPGLGKSSSLRSLCAEFASRGECFPVFLPLQLLHSSGSLEERIHAALRTRVPDYQIEHELLSHTGEIGEDRAVVLVFDGLDELIQSDNEAGDAALRDFIQHVEVFLNSANRGKPKARFLSIISGRTGAADRASPRLGLARSNIAHLLPFCLTEVEKKLLYGSPTGFVEADQRDEWWARWHERVPGTEATMLDALKRDDLFELSREPLLLYFLVFVAAWEDATSESEFNRNTVYSKVLRKFHERECEKKHSNLAKAFRDYDQAYEPVLQCLALAAWYDGSTRKGVVADVETAIASFDKTGELSEAFEKTVGVRDPAFGASLAFHLKPTADGKTFEFLHKSFAEYLVARRFVGDVWHFAAKAAPSHSIRGGPNLLATLREWLETWGAQRIDEDLLRFIKDEARLSASELVSCLDGMSVLMREAVAAGLPAHEIRGLQRARHKADRFADLTDWARNAEEALLVGLHTTIIAALGDAEGARCLPVSLSATANDGARSVVMGNLLARLQRQIDQGFIAGKCLSGLDLARTHLSRAYLRGAELYNVALTEANLGRADLRGANLRGANLRKVVLTGADLSGAYLSGANLSGANLSGADVSRAGLSRANLSGADLSGADVSWADLRKANLVGATLGRANLREADFGGAKLMGAKLMGASLRGANLEKAYLEGAKLAKADLRGAKLGQADLRGAEFGGANLCGADFGGAKLCGAFLDNNSFVAEVLALRQAQQLDEVLLPEGWSVSWNEEDEAWDITTPSGPYVDPRERKAKS